MDRNKRQGSNKAIEQQNKKRNTNPQKDGFRYDYDDSSDLKGGK